MFSMVPVLTPSVSAGNAADGNEFSEIAFAGSEASLAATAGNEASAIAVAGDENAWEAADVNAYANSSAAVSTENSAYWVGVDNAGTNAEDHLDEAADESGLVTSEAMNAAGSDIVEYAMQYEGYPYQYAGEGPDAFDCSGFVKYVFGHFGTTLPHGTTVMWQNPGNYGTVVSEGDALPGDVVLWEGHSGIYIGNGQLIHARNSRYGVCVNNVSYFVDSNGASNPPHYYIRIYGTTTSCSHSWNSGTVTKAAGCTADGIRTYTCTKCGKTRTESITATGHGYSAGVVTKEAGCTEDGVRTYTCVNCGDAWTENIPMTGHSYSAGVVTKEAGCTEDGVRTYTCVNCGDAWTENIPMSGHSYSTGVVTKAPGCTTEGVRTYRCSNCDATKTESIAATGHSMTGGLTTSPPKCTVDGERTYYCSRCGATRIDSVPMLGHNYQISAEEEASCTAPGTVTYTCSRCADSYTEVTADAAGHTWAGQLTEFPDGTAKPQMVCLACGDTVDVGREWVELAAVPQVLPEELFDIEYRTTERQVAQYTPGEGWVRVDNGTVVIENGVAFRVYTWEKDSNWTADPSLCGENCRARVRATEEALNAAEHRLILPRGTKTIGDGAFEGNSMFRVVILPEGAAEIGSRAFADCSSLVRIEIPGSVQRIAEDAFAGSPNVVILCPAGSAAAAFAAQNGIAYSTTSQ